MPGRPDIIACPSQEPALSARPDMNTITGRSAFLALLEDEGVTHLFGNPGTTELPIMDALPEYPGLRYVLGLQEGVVLSMVDGFARATRRLAACNVHVEPGLGNAMDALYNAKWCGSPVLVTAGQQEQGHGLTEPLLYGPLVEMAVKRRSILTPDRSAFSPPLTCEGARSSYRRRGASGPRSRECGYPKWCTRARGGGVERLRHRSGACVPCRPSFSLPAPRSRPQPPRAPEVGTGRSSDHVQILRGGA